MTGLDLADSGPEGRAFSAFMVCSCSQYGVFHQNDFQVATVLPSPAFFSLGDISFIHAFFTALISAVFYHKHRAYSLLKIAMESDYTVRGS
jgi:hypothetical protein